MSHPDDGYHDFLHADFDFLSDIRTDVDFSTILSTVYHLRIHLIIQLMELEDNGCVAQDGLNAHYVLRV